MKGRNEPHYWVEDKSLDAILKQASIEFEKFSDRHEFRALQYAISLMNEAVNFCESRLSKEEKVSSYYLDYAYCLRKFASIVIRDENDERRYPFAKKILEDALNIYDEHSGEDEVILLERQRALDQLRKVAYELKDGALLEKSVNQLIPLAENNDSANFLINCYESLFHLAFANDRLDKAMDAIEKAILIAEINHYDVKKHYIHMLKSHLVNLQSMPMTKAEKTDYFEKHIVKVFWKKVYDIRKEELSKNPNSEKLKTRMVKDLIFLFTLRCQKALLGFDKGNPIAYVLKQAKEIFGSIEDPEYIKLKSMLNNKMAHIKKSGKLTLDYQFFKDKPAPYIAINEEEAKRIFIERQIIPNSQPGGMWKDERSSNADHKDDASLNMDNNASSKKGL